MNEIIYKDPVSFDKNCSLLMCPYSGEDRNAQRDRKEFGILGRNLANKA